MRKLSERRTQGLAVVEGEKETGLALKAGYEVDSAYICSELAENTCLVEKISAVCPYGKFHHISREIFARLAYRDDSGGILLIVKTRHIAFNDIKLPHCPLVVVLEKVEKPGNLGAVLRSCDAAGVDLLILCDPATDIYNPNVIRSGIGCVFTQQLISCSSHEAITWLKSNQIKIFAAALQTEKLYHHFDFSLSAALVFGTESEGLSTVWTSAADHIIKIPMLGHIDSLNVSNSVAVMIYEARRQRDLI